MIHQRWANWLLHVLTKLLWKEIDSKEMKFFWSLAFLDQKVFSLRANKFQWGCQNCLLRVKWKKLRFFWKKMVFFFIQFLTLKQFFGANKLQINFRHAWRNCILMVPMNILRDKRFFSSFKFYILFRSFNKTLFAI